MSLSSLRGGSALSYSLTSKGKRNGNLQAFHLKAVNHKDSTDLIKQTDQKVTKNAGLFFSLSKDVGLSSSKYFA